MSTTSKKHLFFHHYISLVFIYKHLYYAFSSGSLLKFILFFLPQNNIDLGIINTLYMSDEKKIYYLCNIIVRTWDQHRLKIEDH